MFLLTACLEVNPEPQTASFYLSSVFRAEALNCTNGNALGVRCTDSSGDRPCTLRAVVSNFRESGDRSENSNFFLFALKDPFW